MNRSLLATSAPSCGLILIPSIVDFCKWPSKISFTISLPEYSTYSTSLSSNWSWLMLLTTQICVPSFRWRPAHSKQTKLAKTLLPRANFCCGLIKDIHVGRVSGQSAHILLLGILRTRARRFFNSIFSFSDSDFMVKKVFKECSCPLLNKALYSGGDTSYYLLRFLPPLQFQ